MYIVLIDNTDYQIIKSENLMCIRRGAIIITATIVLYCAVIDHRWLTIGLIHFVRILDHRHSPTIVTCPLYTQILQVIVVKFYAWNILCTRYNRLYSMYSLYCTVYRMLCTVIYRSSWWRRKLFNLQCNAVTHE